MNKKELTPTQIEYLFKFMRQKYVRYYDVQIELVDHFASAIEEMWETNPSISFEKAVKEVYSEFPVTGFNNLINEKIQAIQNRLKKHTWKEVKAYLTIPKVTLTLLLCAVFNILYSNIPYPYWFAYGIILGLTFLSFFILKRTIKNQKHKTKFLVLELLIGSQSLFAFMQYLPIYVLHGEQMPPWASILFSIATVFAILVAYGHHMVASVILEEWKQQFPEFV